MRLPADGKRTKHLLYVSQWKVAIAARIISEGKVYFSTVAYDDLTHGLIGPVLLFSMDPAVEVYRVAMFSGTRGAALGMQPSITPSLVACPLQRHLEPHVEVPTRRHRSAQYSRYRLRLRLLKGFAPPARWSKEKRWISEIIQLLKTPAPRLSVATSPT